MNAKRDKARSFPSPVTDGGGVSAADGGGLRSSSSPVTLGGGDARATGRGGSSRPYHKPIIATNLATTRSKELRTNTTPPERILWRSLRNKQLAGMKFRRQHPLGAYIADFFCLECALVIEIDGHTHSHDQKLHDTVRDRWMQSQGLRVLRFSARDIFSNIEAVVRTIQREATNQTPSVSFADTSPVGDGGGD